MPSHHGAKMDPRERRDLTAAARTSEPRPICCPCGGDVVLGGEPAPTYTCEKCGAVTHTLMTLVPVAESTSWPRAL